MRGAFACGNDSAGEAAQSSSPDTQRAGRPCSHDLVVAVRCPPPAWLLLRFGALDPDDAEASVLTANIGLELVLFDVGTP